MKRIFLLIVSLFVVFFIAALVSDSLQSRVLYLTDSIKNGFLDIGSGFSNGYERHFSQAEHIEQLQANLDKAEQTKAELSALQAQFSSLNEAINTKPSLPHIALAQTISFVSINDYNRIWLRVNNLQIEQGRIFGLISDNAAAGIAIAERGRLLGRLNGDEKCSYSVIIGEQKLPGVARFDPKYGLVIDFVPMFPKIQIGEIVSTSGLDGIFYPNIFVGKVASIEERQGYQTAILEPRNERTQRFYWLVDMRDIESNLLEIDSIESK